MHEVCPIDDMTSRPNSSELLYALQIRTARIAIGSSSMRGRGSEGVVEAGSGVLNSLPLISFGKGIVPALAVSMAIATAAHRMNDKESAPAQVQKG